MNLTLDRAKELNKDMVTENVPIMTLHFYAPIYMLLTVCDREPEREQEALELMEKHIRQFDKLYGRNF